MASKFLDETSLAGIEAQMQQIPGFMPRKSGMSVNRAELSGIQGCGSRGEEAGNCGLTDENGSCERSGNGCGCFTCLLGHFTGEVRFGPFTERVLHIEGSAGGIYRDENHRERFRNQWEKQEAVPDRNAAGAALYLLTADPLLWKMASGTVGPEQIDFAAICIRGIGLDGYVLFHTAKDLYIGTNRLSLSELTDRELIGDSTFRTVITAFLIRRYGEKVLEERRSGCLR